MSGEVDSRSVTVKQASKLLRLPQKAIRAHLKQGLPSKDGRIDLVVYAAWLNRQLQESRDGTDASA